MDNVCFEVKKCVANAFCSDPAIHIYKKLNLWEKTAVEESAWIKACRGVL